MDLSVCFEEFYWDLFVFLFVVIPLMRGQFFCDFAAVFLKDCFSFKPVWDVKATALMCDLHNLVVGELPE